MAREVLAPYGERVSLIQASYDTLPGELESQGWPCVDGIILDLGASSMQFDAPGRGFSFQIDAPLDMRFNQQTGMTAAQLINTMPENELADILYEYGEEPRARKIARLVVQSRPVGTTAELASIAKRAYPERQRMHPATRTFQALRIAVNDELACLRRALPRALAALCSGGRLAVISFHSLEDRIVKRFFREQAQDHINPPYTKEYEVESRATIREITRKAILPTDDEVRRNPRARSARLRIAEKI